MKEINKSVYSLFNNINTITTLTEKKKIKSILKDFTDCICELYGIDRDSEIKNIEANDDTVQFLIKLGVIDNPDEISILKSLLNNDYNSFISIVNKFLNLN